jgi:hypothetical protein
MHWDQCRVSEPADPKESRMATSFKKFRSVEGAFLSVALLSAFQAGRKPEGEFAGVVRTYLSMGLPTDWEGIEKLPGLKWAPLPPTMLQNGGCFTR